MKRTMLLSKIDPMSTQQNDQKTSPTGKGTDAIIENSNTGLGSKTTSGKPSEIEDGA